MRNVSNNVDDSNSMFYVGLDVHAKSISVAFCDRERARTSSARNAVGPSATENMSPGDSEDARGCLRRGLAHGRAVAR